MELKRTTDLLKQSQADLFDANTELIFQNEEKEKRAAELAIANKELLFQNKEKEKRAAELMIAAAELEFQNEEKEKRAAELAIANKELLFQNKEKEKRAAELLITNKELLFQNEEKEKRASELLIANKELLFQNKEKEKRAAELVIANKELLFQNEEKEKRASELLIANKELIFQNEEKEKRAAELMIAGVELEFQNEEKENRASELIIANKELLFQNEEKEKLAAELIIAGVKLEFQNKEKEKQQIISKEMEALNQSVKLVSQYSRSLIEASLDPLVTISTEGKITDVNEASIKVTGVGRELLTGSDFSTYFTEPQKAKEGYEQVFKNGFVSDYPLTIKHKTGKLTDVLYNASLYKDDKGNVLGVFAAARDNTNQKQISHYARSLIEASLDPLVTISTDGKIMDMNEAMVEVTDKSRGDLKGTNFNNYFTDTQKAKDVYEEVFTRGFVTDYPLTMKDGKLTDVLFNGSVYKDAKGNVQGAVVVARDVSEQRKIENNLLKSLKEVSDYKYALDASSIVEVTDEKGVIKYVNENFCKISQYSAAELIGTTHSIINSGYHSKEFMVNLWATITAGKIWRDEIKNKAKDGSFYWVLTTIVPFLNESGTPYQYVAIRTDITGQKRIEEELTEAKVFAELATAIAEEEKIKAEAAAHVSEDAVKSKQQFLSNMSHEIRTPMNAIIGFTKVILKTGLTEKQKEYLTAIKMSGDALIVLINDILDLAKVDAGKMTFEQTPFKMALSVTAMLHLFDTKMQEKNLQLIKNYDTEIPAVLVGDPARLHQIILNLISNAVKFTTKGKITVNVKLLHQNEEKATVEFTITDTGIGIPENKLTKIFDNFQQASRDTSRLYGGTGLGLAIVKNLVEAQGGNIKVKSKINEGTAFSFVLDFKKTKAEVLADTEIMELDREIKDIKVLVVEDMALNQLLMKTLLDDFGFERDIVNNGKLAIEKLKAKAYDIILMDLQMPEMNGFETTEYIRKTMQSKIPIIALTADVTTVDLEKCKAAGMDDYIAKPVDERLLYSKIVGLTKKPVVIVSKEMLIEAIEENKLIKCIDLKYLNQRTKSNPVLMMEMIALYLEQTPPLINLMKKSFINKDWISLHSAVHKMIPSFNIMGINPDYEVMAKKVQDYATAQLQQDGIHELIIELENILGQSCKELEEEYNMMKNIKK
jgi:PAS domain S-box-containing protein